MAVNRIPTNFQPYKIIKWVFTIKYRCMVTPTKPPVMRFKYLISTHEVFKKKFLSYTPTFRENLEKHGFLTFWNYGAAVFAYIGHHTR